MANKADGGPAFPLAIAEIQGRATTANDFGPDMTGMSLRDWFAGQAMNGIVASPNIDKDVATDVAIAKASYELADAMLAAREK